VDRRQVEPVTAGSTASAERSGSPSGLRAAPPAALTTLLVRLTGLAFSVLAAVAILHLDLDSFRMTFPHDLGDPALTSWAMSWDWRVAILQHANPFDANIYWPNRDALAFSDNMLALSVVYGPALLVTGSWTTAYNVTTIVLLVVCFWATYALAQRLGGRFDAALVAAFAFSFGSYVTTNLAHIQLLALGVLPFAFLQLLEVLQTARARPAFLLGLTHFAMVTSALYYFAVWTVCVPTVVVLYFLFSRKWPGIAVIRAFSITAGTSLLALPVLIQYFFVNPTRVLRPEFGLEPSDFVKPTESEIAWQGLAHQLFPSGYNGEHALFPGALVLVLALVGAAALLLQLIWRPRRSHRGEGPRLDREEAVVESPSQTSPQQEGRSGGLAPNRPPEGEAGAPAWILLLIIAAAIVALLLAFGGDPPWHRPSPFRVFHLHVPGFAGIQAPVRFGVVALLAIALLAAYGYAALSRRMPAALRALALGLVVVLLGAELATAPTRVAFPVHDSTTAVYRELVGRPAGAVVEMPIPNPRSEPSYPFVEAPRMVLSTIDLHPRVNGYSGLEPQGYESDTAVLSTFPSDQAWERLRALRVRYIVLHLTWLGAFEPTRAAWATATVSTLPGWVRVGRYGDAYLLDLGPQP
jgi:hypothetical protein